jgi:predicted nuclease of restriction endonuclease-like (RecB) superfamily
MPAKKKTALTKARKEPVTIVAPGALLSDVRELISAARQNVARGVNAAMVLLYWKVGERIRREVLQEKRADYGDRIVSALATQLESEFGKSFAERNLRRMIQFSDVFSDLQIVSSLTTQLTWSHFVDLLPLKNHLQRDFYAEMCRIERWSTRRLREKISGMLYERTAISKKPEKLIQQEIQGLREQDRLTPDLIFRDPYLLDFLGLKDTYSEQDLEAAILRELESFLIELGGDFAFVARQKRFVVDGEDFYIDLLFYHRRLRRLVVIDLKLGKFAPADVGQMEFYMRWVGRNETLPGEEPPLGLILCAGKSSERIEIFELADRGIRVSEYLTALPPKKTLAQKLHQAVQLAHQRLEQNPDA